MHFKNSNTILNKTLFIKTPIIFKLHSVFSFHRLPKRIKCHNLPGSFFRLKPFNERILSFNMPRYGQPAILIDQECRNRISIELKKTFQGALQKIEAPAGGEDAGY